MTPVDDRPEPPRRPPTDLRRHRRDTDRRLFWGGIAIMFVVGGGLLLWIFDAWAVLGAWLCLVGALGVIGLLFGLLKLMEWWSDPARDDD
jgi:fatty acid desaturase